MVFKIFARLPKFSSFKGNCSYLLLLYCKCFVSNDTCRNFLINRIHFNIYMYKISHHFHILPSSNLQLIKHAFTWFYHNGCFCIHPLGVLITDTFNSSEFETFSLGKVKSNWPSAWFWRKIHRLFSTFYMECMSVLIFILFIDYKQKLVYTAKHGKHWSVCLCWWIF